MLQQLRDQTQSTPFKVLVVAIILVLTLFGFGATNIFLGGDPTVAQVGDFDITETVLNVETEREKGRILSQVGPDFDPNDIDRIKLQQSALGQLINRQVLYQTAADLGIKVSSDEVNEQLLTSPVYQIDGKFNEGIYRQQLQMLGYQPVEFLREYQGVLSAEQLRSGVAEGSLVPDWEVAEALRILEQRRDFAYLSLDVAAYAAAVEVTDEEIEARYADDRSLYMTPLTIDVEYVRLAVADLASDLEVDVSDEELSAMYEIDRAAASSADARDSSHILIQTNDGVDEAAALQRINEIAGRISQGENFAAVAKETSEDLGSAEQGGSLGLAGKGIFEVAFEEALWELTTLGQVSAPVQTEFGFHLIQLNNIIVTEYPSFENELPILRERVKTELAEEQYSDQLDQLERSSFDERFSLQTTAAELDLPVVQMSGLTEDFSPSVAEGDEPAASELLLSNPDLLQALFSEVVLGGENSEMIQVSDTESVVVRVAKQYEPMEIALVEVTAIIQAQLRNEKGLAALEEAKLDALTALAANTGFSEVATTLGQRWVTLEGVARVKGVENVPLEILQEAFRLPRPTTGEKSIGSADFAQGSALVVVTEVTPGDVNATTDTQLEQFRQIIGSRVERAELTAFFQAAESAIGVVRPE
ncbi:MAG: SurA N-terminal domain-containing protein [Pseudomonadales bacterium]|jgi:peptidyl-prolyl cis-trans isomerase D|tara:strand:+ start:1804 stop:3744 length:1941 start_codon:yes stop_codon:yes gene_type:complete